MKRKMLAMLVAFQAACAGSSNQDSPATPVSPPVGPQWLNATAISVGGDNACAISPTAGALCWGAPTFGKLGVGLMVWPLRPTRIAGNVPFIAVTTGYVHSCALTAAGRAYCWGDNTYQKLGDTAVVTRENITRWQPIAVNSDTAFKSLTLGQEHTCGLTSRGVALCWGEMRDGKLGIGSVNLSLVRPTVVSGSLSFSALAAGARHTCGITIAGDLFCWGQSRPAVIPYPDENRFSPVRVANAPKLIALTAGSYHTCGLTADGIAYCWGWNEYGQLGDGVSVPSDPRLRLTNTERTSPTIVSGNIRFGTISASAHNTCGISLQGQAYCWGWNIAGQIGDGTKETRFAPTAVSTSITFRSIGAGSTHSCGIATDNSVYCWGWGDKGQLGDGTTTSSVTPQKVLAPEAVP
jgi:alpha-tubulin suppressor-like RCC1 family protein